VTEQEQKPNQSYPVAPDRLTREQFVRVIQLATELDDEATQCANAGAFTAASVTAACALEAMLLANVLAQEPDMERAGTWPSSKRPPEEWRLSELLRFHLDQGWISATENPRLVETTHWANDLRAALVHPGRLIRDAPNFVVDEAAFSVMYGILHAAFDETSRVLYGADERKKS
jgi:hypothetical protein